MTQPALLHTPPSIADPVEPDIESILPNVELIESDGEPMESDWHVRETSLLLQSFDRHFRDRIDCYYAGNMFLYYSVDQARNRDFKGPDFFFVSETTREPRRPYWALWLENARTPDVVIELCSPDTVKNDYAEKKRIYERVLHVSDYFCYDPTTQRLDGWRLDNKRYRRLSANEQGRLWSEELQLWLGAWRGKIDHNEDVWLRFFDSTGNLVWTPMEAEYQRAEEEKRLRLAAEAELTRLRELLALVSRTS